MKPITMAALQRADATLRDLSQLLRMKLLNPGGLLGFVIPHASSGECWQDSFVDWLVHGGLSICERNGYTAFKVIRVITFTVGAPRIGLLLAPVDISICPAEVRRHVAKWREVESWNTARPKQPVAESAKYNHMSSSLVRLCVSEGVSSVLLHEPGFHFILPAMKSAGFDVTCCVRQDQVQANELDKRGVPVAPEWQGGHQALLLFGEGGSAAWRELWLDQVKRWLESITGGQCFLVGLLVESSNTKGVNELLAELEASFEQHDAQHHRVIESPVANISRRSLLLVWTLRVRN